jgi:hypothetical protein
VAINGIWASLIMGWVMRGEYAAISVWRRLFEGCSGRLGCHRLVRWFFVGVMSGGRGLRMQGRESSCCLNIFPASILVRKPAVSILPEAKASSSKLEKEKEEGSEAKLSPCCYSVA